MVRSQKRLAELEPRIYADERRSAFIRVNLPVFDPR